MNLTGMAWFVTASMLPLALAESSQTPAATERIKVCAILTKEEVKQHLPWDAKADNVPPREEPVAGPAGSICTYPSVTIWVMPIPAAGPAVTSGFEPLSGVGEQAYFRAYRTTNAQLIARKGTQEVRVFTTGSQNLESARQGAIAVAKAVVAKLR